MLDVDRSVPVLVVKVGRYPLHHGGVGAIRTLGRLGVPVYAVTEDRFTPAAVSRHLTGRFVWPTTGSEAPEALVDRLLDLGRRVGRRAILLPTDDEAAVLVAERAGTLSERFSLPSVPVDLPRKLADKAGLYELCRATGTPAPVSARPGSVDELLAVAAGMGYPVVLKNAAPWSRLQRPAVASSTVVGTEDELRAIAAGWTDGMRAVLVQEYLPHARSQDWIVGLHCDEAGSDAQVFTGRKVRSWPPHAGVATRAFTAANPELAALTVALCRAIGYRGVGDLDWRFDERDGRYKLLDFNPRIGAQFRLFETDAGVDLVRALHLDLTGRSIPGGHVAGGRSLRVENLDLPAMVAYRGDGRGPAVPRGHTELAWLSLDDPLPALAAAIRSAAPAVGLVRRRAQRPTNS
ncbi:MAG: ATP-grasp domain-containing protein [Acidimicrobiales bacterium]